MGACGFSTFRIYTSHKKINNLGDDVGGLLKALRNSLIESLAHEEEYKGLPNENELNTMRTLDHVFSKFKDSISSHFEEEHKVILYMRETLRYSQIGRIEREEVLTTLKWFEIGNLLHDHDVHVRKRWAKSHALPIGGKKGVLSSARQYDKQVAVLLDQITDSNFVLKKNTELKMRKLGKKTHKLPFHL
mmetsp:Transcript_21137/g.29622  ORF Transcript_21137/g.29622 Transcript_21137/m.29622 type:complete len:189 (-) Transcript_21137:496-1062(-)